MGACGSRGEMRTQPTGRTKVTANRAVTKTTELLWDIRVPFFEETPGGLTTCEGPYQIIDPGPGPLGGGAWVGGEHPLLDDEAVLVEGHLDEAVGPFPLPTPHLEVLRLVALQHIEVEVRTF